MSPTYVDTNSFVLSVDSVRSRAEPPPYRNWPELASDAAASFALTTRAFRRRAVAVPVNDSAKESATFTSIVVPDASASVVFHEGFYYWCSSENDLDVAVFRSKTRTESGEKTIVWRAPNVAARRSEVWAPELHRFDDKWYIYVAALNGRNETNRMIVLEATGDEPTGGFRFKAGR